MAKSREITAESLHDALELARLVALLVPQKRHIEKDVLSLPLTRRQRCVYFLVDGHRTLSDLARTTGKTVQEVELILSELQEQGLISV